MDIERIRSDFPMLNTQINGQPLVYLDNSATTHKPQQVIDSIVDFYTTQNSNIHRGVHHLGNNAGNRYESVRGTMRDFLGASSEKEIVFTSGTTEAINLVASSLGNILINKGDEIIISEMEHHANIVPWQALCERTGATLKMIPITDDGVLDVDRLTELISSRTKIISLTYVSNVLGTINPIKEITSLAHNHDIVVVVDGAQAVPHLSVDIKRLDCDFFMFSGHKVYAEMGVGVLYGKEEWLEKMPPYHYGGGMISSVKVEKTRYADIPFRFEAGTRNIAAVISLDTALDYVTTIGYDRIQAHEHKLLNYAMNRIQELENITVYGHAPKRCGIISLTIDGIHHYDAATILDQMGIAIRSGTHCAEPLMKHYDITGSIRASFALYNSKEDIKRFIDGLQKVKEIHHQ